MINIQQNPDTLVVYQGNHHCGGHNRMKKPKFSRGDKKKKKASSPPLLLFVTDEQPYLINYQHHTPHLLSSGGQYHHHNHSIRGYKTHFLLLRLRLKKCRFKLNWTTTIIVYFLIFAQLLLLPLVLSNDSPSSTSSSPFLSSSLLPNDTSSTTTPSSFLSSTTSDSIQQLKESGERCTFDFECGDNLVCAKPKRSSYSYCDCDNKNYTWSTKYQKCVGLVDTRCTVSKSGEKLLCVDNAACVIRSERGFGVCECTASYLSTEERTCEIRYGYPCVNDKFANLCHKEQLLNCIGGFCRCKFANQMKFDKDHQQCRMLDGEPCHTETELHHREHETVRSARLPKKFIRCTTGSICVGNSTLRPGKCYQIPKESTPKFVIFNNNSPEKSTDRIIEKKVSQSSVPTLTTSTLRDDPTFEENIVEDVIILSASISFTITTKPHSFCVFIIFTLLIILIF